MFDPAILSEKLRQLVEAEASKAEQDVLIAEITANVPDPEWMDHVFHSSDFERTDGMLDYPAVSAHILAYKAIQL